MTTDFDVVVVGATAPGIVTAVRAAREGLTVALVAPRRHLGGSLPSLGAFETRYQGSRSPLLQELIDAVVAHYRRRYGEASEQFQRCRRGKMITFEPHVAEQVLESFVAAESRIVVWRECRPCSVERNDRRLTAVSVERAPAGDRHRLTARAFVEAGDEGDFMALAGVSWRLGREARSEFDEPHAGRVFTRWVRGEFPREAVEGRLNLMMAGATTLGPEPGSSGAGDDQVQSCSYRLCLTDAPANRRKLEAPPDGYDRCIYTPILLPPAEKERRRLPFHHRFQIYSLADMVACDHLFHGHALPNRKRSWNATNLVGGGAAYPEAAAAGRAAIDRKHLDHALGLLWFLQNDPAMPADLQAKARQWGLASDEFADTGNIPSELYVREARRLVGRETFREQDALIAPGSARAPVHGDAIAVTDFPLDSLACTTERQAGTLGDGQFFQTEVSRPGQVPFGSLLPRELDNLIVVTTISATHVGWAALRLTPTLMHLAESAGWALVLAAREGICPAQIDVRSLQRTLVEHDVMITFFNDFDMACREPWVAAVQYLGARGFFPGYDARAEEFAAERDWEQWGARAPLIARRGELCLKLYRER